MMNLHHLFFHVLPAFLLCSRAAHQSDLETIQVRLINGSSQYEGTVQYTGDNGHSWHSVCGANLDINVVKVICRQLGFSGANRNIRNSPFGSEIEAVTTGFNCAGGEHTIGTCQNDTTCPSSGRQLGAAICYDKRYLGCFNDLPSNRVLPGNRLQADDLSIESCIRYCNRTTVVNYVYAGVKGGNQCNCGDASADYERHGMVGDERCQLQCTGDAHSSCGGNGKIAIFNLSVVITPSDTQTTDTKLVTIYSILTTLPEMAMGLEDTNTTTTSIKLGAGVGGSFLLITIIVIIVVFVKYKRRKVNMDVPAVGHQMISMAKSSSNKSRTDASPDQSADLSLLYALPYEQTAMNAADVGALYAVSIMKKGNDHVKSDGVGMHAPLEEYHTNADAHEDNTVMIENEIYNC